MAIFGQSVYQKASWSSCRLSVRAGRLAARVPWAKGGQHQGAKNLDFGLRRRDSSSLRSSTVLLLSVVGRDGLCLPEPGYVLSLFYSISACAVLWISWQFLPPAWRNLWVSVLELLKRL